MSAPTLTFDVGLGESSKTMKVRLIRVLPSGARVYGVQSGSNPECEVEVTQPETHVRNLLIEGRSVEAGLVATPEGFLVDIGGIPHEMSVVDPRSKALRRGGAEGAGLVKSQMPGRVVRLLVAVGEEVAKGTPLMVIEAMKMENEIKSPRVGVVARLCVKPGDLVEAKAELVELA
jgi:biotin carboxyl carrier protein